MEQLPVGVIAMNSRGDVHENWRFAKGQLEAAAGTYCKWLVLPEMFLAMGDPTALPEAAALFQDEVLPYMQEFCRSHRRIIFSGSVPVYDPDASLRRPTNTLFVIDAQGQVIGRYDKRFLFQLDVDGPAGAMGGKPIHDETAQFAPGSASLQIQANGWSVGLAICYDLRFPQHFLGMASTGAGVFDVLVIPSAFTAETGAAHWEVLLRARAIEYQCYVVAPNQCGRHGQNKNSFGHSLVIDPWGQVILNTGENIGMGTVVLEKSRVQSVRARIPASKQLRS